jgi:L-lysine 2,3-aminomutase
MPVLPCRTDSQSRYLPSPDYPDWQSAAADCVRDAAELCRLLDLPPSLAEAARNAAGGFPLLVPRTFLSRIRVGDGNDPLLRQVLPTNEELEQPPQFARDPIGEVGSALSGCILRKYKNRALMITTGVCAAHCRFCFRRHFPYHQAVHGDQRCQSGSRLSTLDSQPNHEAVRGTQRYQQALGRIARETTVQEVILSGGDPLSLGDRVLGSLIEGLGAIPHLRRLRIHTRQPVLIPQRVSHPLLGRLRATRLTVIVVLHINHPAEIDKAVEAAIGRLVDAGLPVLQQGVLLRGINDRVEVLAELYERLADLRVIPYYLHQLDRVAGAAHFEVPEDEGVRLIEHLRSRLPGYAVPRYVRELAGAPHKVVLA